MTNPPNHSSSHKPLYLALGCYTAWGIFPLYWHLLKHLTALETLAHRFIWSFVFYAAIMGVMWATSRVTLTRASAKEWGMAAIASLTLGLNWGIFIYAINQGRVLEGSLAYFINPLLSMVVGVIFFKEPFPSLMKFAFGMAMLGVLIKASFGAHFPWIALTLAFSFCAYGVVKKTIQISPTQFSVMESGVGVIPALALAFYAREQSEIALQTSDWLLLVGAGVVTGLPLFLFAIAAQQLPYSLMGMLQFIGPTLQFMCGIFIFHEALSGAGILAFFCIWVGVGAYLVDKLHQLHKSRKIQAEVYVE